MLNKDINLTISIIIPTYNEKENLAELAEFFKHYSTYNDLLEIIVVDALKKSDKPPPSDHIFTYLPFDKSSRAAQMNFGAVKSKGDILIFLHADVRPPKSFLDDICKAINEGNEFGFFAYQFYPTSWILNINSLFTKFKGIFAGGGDQIHFITRKLFFELKGYNEKYIIMEDFNLMKRIKSKKIPYCVIQNKAQVSSRKYSKNSWIRVNLANLIAFVQFHLNVKPETIKKTYNYLLKR